MHRRALLQAFVGLGFGSAGARHAPSERRPRSKNRPSSDFRAGTAKIDITPEKPVSLEGYLDPGDRVSSGVHDRLFARAFAFGSGTDRLVLVSCDVASLALGAYFRRAILDAVPLAPEQLLLCATHTHSGPLLTLHPGYPANVEYTKAFARPLIAVVRDALQDMRPARLLLGRGTSAIGVSRRRILPDGRVVMASNPDGTADHDLLALHLVSPSGRPFAALFDYACHSRSLRAPNTLLSGDIFGIAAQHVESTHAGVVAGAFAGASGDIDPIAVVDGFGPTDAASETVRLGTRLGGDVVRALNGSTDVSHVTPLRSSTARLSLPPKHTGAARSVDVTVAKVGDVGFVGLDCEASVEIGLAIKAGSPSASTFVITNCNGWSGYLPVARQFTEGGYEVERTGFGPAAADRLVTAVVAMLTRLWDAPVSTPRSD